MTISTEELFRDLDRTGGVPLYLQIARRMQSAIESGELEPGSRIENELRLAELLAISRPTIRRAIQELVDQGLLVRRRGIGTQVVRGRLSRNVELTSLHDDLTSSHRSPATRVLLLEEVVPSAEILERLTLPPGTVVLHLKRLRLSDDVPLALLENYLPPEFLSLGSDDLERDGLYSLMRAAGATMRVARQTIGARGATAEEASHFGQADGSPVLTMTRTLYDQSGHAVEFAEHSYRPDLYSFEMTVVEK